MKAKTFYIFYLCCLFSLVVCAQGLKCAKNVFATPNTEFMHKLPTTENYVVKEIIFGKGLDNLHCHYDRIDKGNKYVYVKGFSPKKEGVYSYVVVLDNNGKVSYDTISLTVSSFLQSPTPMMGWLSWNWFESWADEKVLLENAHAIKNRGLLEAGYRYFILDDKWAIQGCSKENLDYDRAKFHSMEAEDGFTTQMHRLGFQVGIYSDAGKATCAYQYQAGSYGYEEEHLEKFEKWGFDMLKYDFCNNEASAQESYPPMGKAIEQLNKQRRQKGKTSFVFNICEWGQNEPWLWASEAGGSSWRATYDSRECWMGDKNIVGVLSAIDIVRDLWAYTGVNRYNDADMMMIGLHGCGSSSNYTLEHPNNAGGNLEKAFTVEQARSQMSMWSMFSSPLTICADFRKQPESKDNPQAILPEPLITEDDIYTLTNKDILSIDQDILGQCAEYISNLSTGKMEEGYDVYFKDLSYGMYAVAILNRSKDTIDNINIPLEEIYLKKNKTYIVKDVWKKQDYVFTIDNGILSTKQILPYQTKVYIFII